MLFKPLAIQLMKHRGEQVSRQRAPQVFHESLTDVDALHGNKKPQPQAAEVRGAPVVRPGVSSSRQRADSHQELQQNRVHHTNRSRLTADESRYSRWKVKPPGSVMYAFVQDSPPRCLEHPGPAVLQLLARRAHCRCHQGPD